jgi:hypothetical protein
MSEITGTRNSQTYDSVVGQVPMPDTKANIMCDKGCQGSSPLRLFFIAHYNDDGESLELFVWSETLVAVADQWRSYYELDDDELPERIFEISIAALKPGAVEWHVPGQAYCVFKDERRRA